MIKVMFGLFSILSVFQVGSCFIEAECSDKSCEPAEITINTSLPTVFEVQRDCTTTPDIEYNDYYSIFDTRDGEIPNDDAYRSWTTSELDFCKVGEYIYNIRITDSDSNITREAITFIVQYSPLYDYIELKDSNDNILIDSEYSTTPDVTLSCLEDELVNSISYKRDSESYTLVDCNNTVNFAEDGEYTVLIDMKDGESKDFIFYIDTTPPTSDSLYIFDEDNNRINSGDTITTDSFTISCDNTVEYLFVKYESLTSSSVGVYFQICEEKTYDSPGSYEVKVYDEAGNYSLFTFTIVEPEESIVE